ncbi:MAG: hypothetical protein ABMA14_27255 [Hyphomonadaceae bacterium]
MIGLSPGDIHERVAFGQPWRGGLRLAQQLAKWRSGIGGGGNRERDGSA